MDLTPEEVRVIGCLAEKQRTTPDDYPLTANSLMRACNQSTSRDPIVSYDPTTVEGALRTLRERGLIRIVHSTSNRAAKYRHVLDEAWGLAEDEVAVLAVLALRGPQTAAEVTTRAERLHPFGSVAEVTRVLDHLASRDEPLAFLLERQPGQKEARWVHLLEGPLDDARLASLSARAVSSAGSGSAATGQRASERIEQLEQEVAALRAEVAWVRAALESLVGPLGDAAPA